jgi:hypothetical protein
MSLAGQLLRDLLGMFVDDKNLVLFVLAVVLLAALFSRLPGVPNGVSGDILVLGCVAALVECTLSTVSPNDRKGQ